MTGLVRVQSIETFGWGGRATTYALMDNGTVEAWGYGADGELGNGTTTNSDIPVPVTGLSGVKDIQTNGVTTYALMDNGTVEAWGSDAYGSLGHGVAADTGIPVAADTGIPVAVFDSSGQ